MITIKNSAQIEKMRKAGAMLHDVLMQVKQRVVPGVTTKELDHFAEKLIRSYGATPSFLNYEGYPASICTSVDSQVVHGIPSQHTVLREGQILSIDAGLILDGWQSDSALTVGVGKIAEEAQRLIDVTEQSFFAALEVAREGNRISDIGHAVQKHAETYGYGVVRALTGHGVGLLFHEEPEVSHVGHRNTGMLLVPGMVFTIEPMINQGTWKVFIDADDEYGWEVITGDELPSAQWEHTFLMTEHGVEILSY